MTSKFYLAFRKLLQYPFQVLLLVAGKIILLPFTQVMGGHIRSELVNKKGYLIVGNHHGALDPFILISSLPWSICFKLLPIGFVTHNVFYDSILRPLCWLSGCYPARNPNSKHKIYGVDGSVWLLSNGFSVCIFPEGRRVKDAGRGQAHNGVIRIHKASLESAFILCRIEYNPGLKAWLNRRRRTVRFALVQNPNYDDPEAVMDDIFAL